MNSDQKEFYTAEEIAKLLSYNIMTIYRYIKAGKINAYKIGKEYRIFKIDFFVFLKKQRSKSSKKYNEKNFKYRDSI